MKKQLHVIVALVGILFGVMTLKTGGSSLFTEEGRMAAGNYVPFVLWFNFTAGFFYIVAGLGILLRKQWARLLAKLLAITTGTIFVAFIAHVLLGGAFEMKTLFALLLRGGFWAMAWIVMSRLMLRGKTPDNQFAELH